MLQVMSIDRYIAVCRPFSFRMQKLRKHRPAYIVTSVVWIIAILLSIPVMIYTDKRGVKPNCFCEWAVELINALQIAMIDDRAANSKQLGYFAELEPEP